MTGIGRSFRNLGRSASGATSIEYALIAAGIFLTIIAAIALAGDAVEALYNEIAAAF